VEKIREILLELEITKWSGRPIEECNEDTILEATRYLLGKGAALLKEGRDRTTYIQELRAKLQPLEDEWGYVEGVRLKGGGWWVISEVLDAIIAKNKLMDKQPVNMEKLVKSLEFGVDETFLNKPIREMSTEELMELIEQNALLVRGTYKNEDGREFLSVYKLQKAIQEEGILEYNRRSVDQLTAPQMESFIRYLVSQLVPGKRIKGRHE
jgi:hypothetical protein